MAEQLASLEYEDAQKQVDVQLNQSLGLIKGIDQNMRELGDNQTKILNKQIDIINRNQRRQRIQEKLLKEKEALMRTRARMLQVAKENNVYKQKMIYTMISFIFAIFIAIIVIYINYSKN